MKVKTWQGFVVLLIAALFVMQPTLAMAGSVARVIPIGKVQVLTDGQAGSSFKSEIPLPEGSMMACDGKCLVQAQGLKLVAKDKAIFALSESSAQWDLAVKTGEIDFAIGAAAKQLMFHTAQESVQVQEAIIPASNQGLVRGTILVTDGQSELAVHEGALRLVGKDGEKLVQPGQVIKLAQANMSPSTDKPSDSDSDKKKAAAVIPAAGGVFGMSTGAAVGIGVVAAAALAGGIAAVASNNTSNSP